MVSIVHTLISKKVCKWTWETIQHYTKTYTKVKEQRLASNDIDVNEHERLSNITQNLGKEQCFNYSSSFHNHRRIFNNEHNSYHTMNGKLPLVSIWEVLITSIGKLYIWASLSFGFYLVMKLHFADGCAVINKTPQREK
jgi:hypothetical protein